MLLELVAPRWQGRACIVAAPGPSLNESDAALCRHLPTIAINHAHRLFPWADVLYAADRIYWKHFKGCPDFRGERWSAGGGGADDKKDIAREFGLTVVRGRYHDEFSLDPSVITYGKHSGFQAINLAILFGARPILLLGFDMRVKDKAHFFGDYPKALHVRSSYAKFIGRLELAAPRLPPTVEVINCTPDSALQCFPQRKLQEVLACFAPNLAT